VILVPYCFVIYLQVQDKKVKRISVMNLDTSQSADNGTTSSSSTSSSRGLPNGGSSEKSYNCANNDLPFPSGGYASLRLPVVVVLNPLYPTSVVLYIHQ
jgi:serine/threonine-protein phosphatase 2A regulatory subunit B